MTNKAWTFYDYKNYVFSAFRAESSLIMGMARGRGEFLMIEAWAKPWENAVIFPVHLSVKSR